MSRPSPKRDVPQSKGRFCNPLPPSALSKFAPSTPESAGMSTRQPTCKECGRPVVWVRTAKDGKRMPLDPKWQYGDWKMTLVVIAPPVEQQRNREKMKPGGHVFVKAPGSVLGREPHFGTCPVLLQQRAEEARRKALAEAEREALNESPRGTPGH